ncbi:hypothetical protein ACHAWF_012178 [Thalassiosira exigua]
MVLAEVPLWVPHVPPGASSGSGGGGGTSGALSLLPGGGGTAGPIANGGAGVVVGGGGGGPGPGSGASAARRRLDDDRAAARSALALLSSTRGGGGGGGGRNAPLYSVDVHPDGTRFATAGGDGVVRVWDARALFGGSGGKGGDDDDDEEEGSDDGSKKGGARGRRATSRFDGRGNYVSSNTEDYGDGSSSEEGGARRRPPLRRKGPAKAPRPAAAKVNDLTSLVRRKKGGGMPSPSKATGKNPFAAAASADASNLASDDGPLSPLSKLTQRRDGAGEGTSAAAGNESASNAAEGAEPPGERRERQRLLSTISSHEGSVLAVRFSPGGQFLATAGDDSYVNVYKLSDAPTSAVGNLVEKTEDVEHWNRVAVCRGHRLDAVGLAWAPDDSHLASVSLDSAHPVIVWKLYDVLGDEDEEGGADGTRAAPPSGTIHNLHPHKILGRTEHASTVKGVAFDPAGRYLVTSGDDPAVCVWRAEGDWGLEARVDGSNSGIFPSKRRRKAGTTGGDGAGAEDDLEDDPGELASLSLFRRISFAPDGSHVCATNATMRGKNVAAMISREGWRASGPPPPPPSAPPSDGGGSPPRSRDRPPTGAANLVGHKQPVVASRHCPVFLAAPRRSRGGGRGRRGRSSGSEESSEEEEDPDAAPSYATLVALGDKRGFVTVWSTGQSRPVFKCQCSEGRCTVTDLAWGKASRGRKGGKEALTLMVSLLDGYVVALRFEVPDEVGEGVRGFLPAEEARRIFRTRYGIDDAAGVYGLTSGKGRRRLVDDAGPVLIENALQMTMEMEAEGRGAEGDDVENDEEEEEGDDSSLSREMGERGDAAKGGKKRVRSALAGVEGGVAGAVSEDDGGRGAGGEGGKKRRRKKRASAQDPLWEGADAASAARAAGAARGAEGARDATTTAAAGASASTASPAVAEKRAAASAGYTMRIPFSASRTFAVDLTDESPAPSSHGAADVARGDCGRIVAECANSPAVAGGARRRATLALSRRGLRTWTDVLDGARCTALAATDRLLVAGTAEGSLHLYAASAAGGWGCGRASRAYPPLVLGSPVVEVRFDVVSGRREGGVVGPDDRSSSREMVVVTSDGDFGVYLMLPSGPKLKYKGSLIPAMQHLCLCYASVANHQRASSYVPKLARIQITESKQLLLILTLPTKSSPSGKVLQGYVYNLDMELWMRISDSNDFMLSDFYSSFSGVGDIRQHWEGGNVDSGGILARVDELVRSYSASSASARQMYGQITENEDSADSSRGIATRSHCEDRLACSLALGSASEFKTWLGRYAGCLSAAGDADGLRFLVDLLLVGSGDERGSDPSVQEEAAAEGIQPCTHSKHLSFLMVGMQDLGLTGKDVVHEAILPAMSKNRGLQRLTNEIAMELHCL